MNQPNQTSHWDTKYEWKVVTLLGVVRPGYGFTTAIV